jgi:hypothetical protein
VLVGAPIFRVNVDRYGSVYVTQGAPLSVLERQTLVFFVFTSLRKKS